MAVVLVLESKNQPASLPTVWLVYPVAAATVVTRRAITVRFSLVFEAMIPVEFECARVI